MSRTMIPTVFRSGRRRLLLGGPRIAEKRVAESRRDQLLDGVMDIIAARGFSTVRMTDMAQELHCSLASLYKIAPNKDSLVVLAIGRWGELHARQRPRRVLGAGRRHPSRRGTTTSVAAQSVSPDVPRFPAGYGAVRVDPAGVHEDLGRLRRALLRPAGASDERRRDPPRSTRALLRASCVISPRRSEMRTCSTQQA